MDMDVLIKYLIWIALFLIALTGIYFLLKRLGVVQ